MQYSYTRTRMNVISNAKQIEQWIKIEWNQNPHRILVNIKKKKEKKIEVEPQYIIGFSKHSK